MSFDQIANLLEDMTLPDKGDHFKIEWLAPETLAVGRNSTGGHCIFMVCDPLAPTIAAVERAIRYGRWQPSGAPVISSNLLALPSGSEFGTAAAAIAAELLRRRTTSGDPLTELFAQVEEFISLVLRRVLLPPDFVLGLLGELVILDELLEAMGVRAQEGDPTAVWRGWMQQARDFVLGVTSIEVKTTGLQVSRHHIHGLEQVEARILDEGATERLFLGSIGLRRTGTGGYSVAELTRRILSRLTPDSSADGELNDSQRRFLDRLAQYGPRDSVGYVHAEMSEQDLYTEGYTSTFPPRFYDMADDNIRLIRTADLTGQFENVRAQGISYIIELPPVVPGSIENPKPDFRVLLRSLVEQSSD